MGAGLFGADAYKKYNSESSSVAFFCCLIAASGGALFGYDNGVMGGVVATDGFLDKFYPSIAEQAKNGTQDKAEHILQRQDFDILPYLLYSDEALVSHGGEQISQVSRNSNISYSINGEAEEKADGDHNRLDASSGR